MTTVRTSVLEETKMVVLVMFVLESLLIWLFPVVQASFKSTFFVRVFAAVTIVASSYYLARLIQDHYFTVSTDMTVFITAFIVVAWELMLYNSYSLRGFSGDNVLDPFNKVLGKFVFTAASVFVAKGLIRPKL